VSGRRDAQVVPISQARAHEHLAAGDTEELICDAGNWYSAVITHECGCKSVRLSMDPFGAPRPEIGHLDMTLDSARDMVQELRATRIPGDRFGRAAAMTTRAIAAALLVAGERPAEVTQPRVVLRLASSR
jgi:hypothetical protein